MSIVGQNALLNQFTPTFLLKNIINGQILIYDSTRKCFINVDPVVSTSSIQKLGQLINVDDSVDSVLVPNGQSLVYNSSTQLWTNQYINYATLLNKPTSVDFTFAGLSDTAKPAVNNGYVKWNSSGTQLVYSTTIPAAIVTGLAAVAISGSFNDLSNKPTSASYSLVGLSDTATPAVANGILKWDGTGTTVTYVSSIPSTQITGLATVATAGTLGSLNNVAASVDTLNNTTDAGKIFQWSGSEWVPANPPMVTVVNISARDTLTPSLGNQAYVIDSDDGNGDYVGEWSLWIYTITGPSNGWTLITRGDPNISESATIEYTFGFDNDPDILIGTLQTGGRVTLITVEVFTPFNAASTLEIGYTINNPSSPPPVPNGLMITSNIDLTIAGTYSTFSEILFGTDTPLGDIDITASFIANGATAGYAQIIVSYV